MRVLAMSYFKLSCFLIGIISLTGCQSGNVIPGMTSKPLNVDENPWSSNAKLRAIHCDDFWSHPDMALQYMKRRYHTKSKIFREYSALMGVGEEEKAEALLVGLLVSLRKEMLSDRGNYFDTFKQSKAFELGDYDVEGQYFSITSSSGFLRNETYFYTPYTRHDLGNIYDPSVTALAAYGDGSQKASTTYLSSPWSKMNKLPGKWTAVSYYKPPAQVPFDDVNWSLDFTLLRLYMNRQDAYELIKRNSSGSLAAVVSYTINGCTVKPGDQYGRNTILTGEVTAIDLHYPRAFGVQSFGKAIASWKR